MPQWTEFTITHTGNVRTNNEDAVTSQPQLGLWVVVVPVRLHFLKHPMLGLKFLDSYTGGFYFLFDGRLFRLLFLRLHLLRNILHLLGYRKAGERMDFGQWL